MHSQTDDLDVTQMIATVEEIVKHTPEREPGAVRRLRHLIAHHGFPVVRIGRVFYSHPAWIKAYYTGQKPQPDHAA